MCHREGAEVVAHILSGAVLDPIALDELFPDWKARGDWVPPEGGGGPDYTAM